MSLRDQGRTVRVVHVGPAPSASGGISSVIRVLTEAEWPENIDCEVVATTCGRHSITSLMLALVAPVRVAMLSATAKRCVVHLHMASKGSFLRKLLCQQAARMAGARTIVHLHGGRFHHFAHGGTWLRRRIIRHSFMVADAVIALSPEWRDRVLEFSGRADVVVLANPVDVPESVHVDEVPPRVTFLGRLGERKGVVDLIEAIRILQEEGLSAAWTIAGDGDSGPVCRQVSSLPRPGEVEVPGWLGREAVARLLSRTSVLALPSYDEGKPVAVLEAMAYGIPCVATTVGGIPDVVVSGVNGLLFGPGDTTALSSHLRMLLEDQGARDRLGAAARVTVEREYDVRVVVEVLVRLYLALTGGRP